MVPAELTTKVSALSLLVVLVTCPTSPGDTVSTEPVSVGAPGMASRAKSKSIERVCDVSTPKLLTARTVTVVRPDPMAA